MISRNHVNKRSSFRSKVHQIWLGHKKGSRCCLLVSIKIDRAAYFYIFIQDFSIKRRSKEINKQKLSCCYAFFSCLWNINISSVTERCLSYLHACWTLTLTSSIQRSPQRHLPGPHYSYTLFIYSKCCTPALLAGNLRVWSWSRSEEVHFYGLQICCSSVDEQCYLVGKNRKWLPGSLIYPEKQLLSI